MRVPRLRRVALAPPKEGEQTSTSRDSKDGGVEAEQREVVVPRDSPPHGTCTSCGWSGHDWAFQHQPQCTRCYRKERRERARDRARVNVEKRLIRTAQAQVPHSVLHWAADRIPHLAGALIAGGLTAYYAFDWRFGIEGRSLLVVWSVGLLVLLVLADRVSDGELSKRLVLVRAKLAKLVEERNRRNDDADAFYASPEWKLLRDAIVKEEGHICRDCGAEVGRRVEATVGHVLPRSKYPHLALSRDNVQVLCGPCSSRRRDREPE